ncbi:MAG TPA: DUF2306 domain-containing protein [Puia sp.]|jgi:hypothetical protein
MKLARFIRIMMFFPAVIGLGAVVRRILEITGVTGSSPFGAGVAPHPFIILLHILPGALFMILGPLLFLPRIRNGYPRFHSRSERVVILCGYIIGLSALLLPFMMKPIGGLNEAAASTFFAIWFLLALTMASRTRNPGLHHEWMIRMFSIGLAIGTIRPIVVLFFIFSGLPPQVFFGTAFWIGFTLHLVLAEAWINYSRKSITVR